MDTRIKPIYSLPKEREMSWSPSHLHPTGPLGLPFAMGNGYKVRTYESCHNDGATGSGTVVLPVDPSFTMSAASVEEVLDWILTNVAQKRLLSRRIYQICPAVGSQEPMISVATGPNGSFVQLSLDPVRGLSGQLRRVRDVQALSPIFDESSITPAA